MKRLAVQGGLVSAIVWLAGILPVAAGATTYTIKEFRQTSGTFTFFDPFDNSGPPPSGPPPGGSSTYETVGTFLAGNEHDGVLDLVTEQGVTPPGSHDRTLGAGLNVSNPNLVDFALQLGTVGSVEGTFVNFAPLVDEGYGILIETISDTVPDLALLRVVDNGLGPAIVFNNADLTVLAFAPVPGAVSLDGTGEISFRLDLDATGAVRPLVDTGAGFMNPYGPTDPFIQMSEFPLTGEFGAGDTIPEPGTLLLFGSGLAGLAGWRRKRRRWIPRDEALGKSGLRV